MRSTVDGAIAIVGVGAIMPDATNAGAFWRNLLDGRDSIGDVRTDRWDPELYYDPDPGAPDKTYSRIGGWVDVWDWEPLAWRLPIPPRVAGLMDRAQKWAIVTAREALLDFGWPVRPLDPERTGVILGNALGGDMHLLSAARILFPEVADELRKAPTFHALPGAVRAAVLEELVAGVRARLPDITEDTMPGELSNIVAGRVAAVFDLRGPNFITDAACASAMAALDAAVERLRAGTCDAVLTGGVDANMGASTFVKFCKIGALSATGSRPYAEGADGFVMGEGAATFLLRRLEDAERDGDRVYAVIRGVGGSSDGRGKGITAPNPAGQRLAMQRAWARAGLAPEAGDLVEGHGTSTRVGDVVEVESLGEVFGGHGLPPGSVALGSVKSNIGHLKAAAGAAGLFKAALALHEKRLPPSLHCERPNPAIDFRTSPFRVERELVSWDKPGQDAVRRAGVSAFGFGGTNFHAVLEEYVPGRLRTRGSGVRGAALEAAEGDGRGTDHGAGAGDAPPRAPLRGVLVVGASDEAELAERLREAAARVQASGVSAPRPPLARDLRAPVRLAIDYADAAELGALADQALAALEAGEAGRWKALRNKGVFLGRGEPGKVAFLFTGQGSQYAGMLRELRDLDPIVAGTFAEADRVMAPLLGGPLTERIFVDTTDEEAVAAVEEGLRQTAVTQPAVLTVDTALGRLFEAYGIVPDMVMGHSLGEYAALVAAGAMSLSDSLTAVSARGRAMTDVALDDNGTMAAVFGPVERVQERIAAVEGYVVVANLNSTRECVIGGATDAMERAVEALRADGLRVAPLPVSHAFHTRIVEPASGPLATTLRGLDLRPPRIPVVANVDGRFYCMAEGSEARIVDMLSRQIGSPVRFVDGLETLYRAGARVFVEMGPKRVLYGLAEDVLGEREGVTALYTNHPRTGDLVSVNRALCGLYALGLGRGMEEGEADLVQRADPGAEPHAPAVRVAGAEAVPVVVAPAVPVATTPVPTTPWALSSNGTPAPTTPLPSAPAMPATGRGPAASGGVADDRTLALGRLFAEFLERSVEVWAGTPAPAAAPVRVGIVGASLGLPGVDGVFDDDNALRLMEGTQLIGPVSADARQAMLERRITRLVKGANGEADFETIADTDEVVKLAGAGRDLDLVARYGFPRDRVDALDRVTRLAIAAGVDALRDAGIPLVRRYRTTTTGSLLPGGWALPEEMRDDTGVIFGSAFPGLDALIRTLDAYHEDRTRRARLAELEGLRSAWPDDADGALADELGRRIAEAERAVAANEFRFDRRFLFQVLSMGHSQFAEHIGARGPNVCTNAACATGTQAIALARDWIDAGRCRRVIVVTADDVTTDAMLPWFGSGFLASGAAATDACVEDAALPFDRRRHGLIVGMGGAALIVERLDATDERGMSPICELLGTELANSAFHGSRLDIEHMADVMERLMAAVEARHGLRREEMAPELVFVSHETYTPARGGSAGAEVRALRRVFGAHADDVVVANTKGFTGHPMAVGIEDVLAVRMLETGIVPPVANFREVDPELGPLNLSRGGAYPVRYALRLAAGFGSQIAMSLFRWTPPADGARRDARSLGWTARVRDPAAHAAWLRRVSGYDRPDLEIEGRTLRLRDQGPPRPVAGRGNGAHVHDVLGTPAHDGRGMGALAASAAPAQPPAPGPLPTPVAALPGFGGAAIVPASASPSTASVGAFPPAGGVEDEVRATVLAIVAEQTGYPADMLELDLDLEADLGIDTVKQAEMFAAIREAYGVERDEKLALRDYPTLAHAIAFVFEKRPDLRGSGAGAADVTTAAAPPTLATTATPAVGTLATAPAPDSEDEVRATVLAIVAEQTGYPADMLELDLDLEADLGIDTVKQAEMFAAIREAYGVERDEKLALRDYPTLAHAIAFVFEKRPDLRAGGAETGSAPRSDERPARGTATQAEPAEHAPEAMLSAPSAASPDGEAAAPPPVAWASTTVPRRIPVSVPRPAAERLGAAGVRLEAGDRVVVVSDEGGVGDALIRRLEDRGVAPLAVDAGVPSDDVAARLEGWASDGPIRGVYWLPALDPVAEVELLSTPARRRALERRVHLLHGSLRALGGAPGGPGTFLVSATRLGGRHGYDPEGATDALGGAVTGYTKAFARERPEALVKAVDVEPTATPDTVADRLLDETLHDAGVVEVGYALGRRWTVGLDEAPPRRDPDAPGAERMTLGRGGAPTWVVTGAAGSIVSAIVADLARAARGTFWLLDLTPAPDPADPDLVRFRTDRDALKLELVERLRAAGERVTPARVERELARLERSSTAVDTIHAVAAAGGTARWRSVDVLDAEAVATVLAEVTAADGGVDVLIHAAGLEISRALTDKSPEEFRRVFDVKAEGWFNLMAGLGDAPLGAAVAFGSIAGRFGNAGQVDYSAANDLLCKAVSSLRRTRPATRGLVLDWTAWADIGMAARGSIPTIMREAGIDLLPPDVGIPVVRHELEAGTRGEVVVAGALGVMLAPRHAPGTDALPLAWDGVLAGRVLRISPTDGLEAEITLDPAVEPFLADHRIDGVPVLPGVMGLEAMAEAARTAFPELHVVTFEDVIFHAPFKLYRDEARTLRVRARFTLDGDDLVAHAEVLGERTLHGRDVPEVTLHHRARVRLAREPRAAPPSGGASAGRTSDAPGADETGCGVGADAVYGVYFHGPAYRVIARAWREQGCLAGRWAGDLPPGHAAADDGACAAAAPRLVELAFQVAGLAEMVDRGRMALPMAIDRVDLLGGALTEEPGIVAWVETGSGPPFDVDVRDGEGRVRIALRGYRTSPLAGELDLGPLEALRG